MVAMTDEMLGERDPVARRNPVAPVPALFDVSGVHSEDVALPLAGGETHPGVRGVVGRMRAAIHPDGPVLLIGADVVPEGDQVLRLRISLLPDPKPVGAAVDVAGSVHLALM